MTPIVLSNVGLKRHPIPSASFYVDCRGLPDPSHGAVLDPYLPHNEALGKWMLAHAAGEVQSIIEVVADALAIIPRRRPGREGESFHICTLCAWGQHRSVAMKMILRDTLRAWGHSVTVM